MGINILENTQDNISRSDMYLMQAEQQRNDSKYKESIENYLNSILIDRNNYITYLGLALSYKNLKNYDKAISTLKKAEKLIPANSEIQKELALCNIIKGEYSLGIKYLINAIKIEPDKIDFQMMLALAHEMIEETDLALMIYQKIIETNPNYIRAYIQKATLYMYLEDYLNSAKIFKQVIKLDGTYTRAYLALAICYEKLGNYNGAKRLYKKYLTFGNSNNKKEILKRINELNNYKTENKTNLQLI